MTPTNPLVLLWTLFQLLQLASPILARLTPKEQQLSCGNGHVGNGSCRDATQCCSRDGFCSSEFCFVVDGRTAQEVPAPSPSGADTPSPTALGDTSAPTAAATPYPTAFGTPYPTVVYDNCPNVPDVMTVNFGYYQSLAAYRQPGCNRVLPGDIDVAGAGYTHLAYSFVGIDSNFTLVPWNSNYEEEVPMYREFNSHKKNNPNLKTIAVIGGWTFNNPGKTQNYFSNITNNEQYRNHFAASVVDFLEKYNFDGVDIDWEFPGRSDRGGDLGGKLSDYKNLPLLVKAIRDAFLGAGRDYIISLAVPPAQAAIDIGFDMKALEEYVDFFTLLSYEIHGPWAIPKTVGAVTDLPFIELAVEYILRLGVAPNKLVFGLSCFGHNYILSSPSCIVAGCNFTEGGPGGCGGSTGTVPFFTINEIIESGEYDYLQQTTKTTMEMSVNKTIYYSFDNQQTWNLRAEYALNYCMRGYFWWAIDQLPGPVPLTPRAGPKPIPPTPAPTSAAPTKNPTTAPVAPTKNPTTVPVPTSLSISEEPSFTPSSLTSSSNPSLSPSKPPITIAPTIQSTTLSPSANPTTLSPSANPTTLAPSASPTPKSKPPTRTPTLKPTRETSEPTVIATFRPTRPPTSTSALQTSGSDSLPPLLPFFTSLTVVLAVCTLLV